MYPAYSGRGRKQTKRFRPSQTPPSARSSPTSTDTHSRRSLEVISSRTLLRNRSFAPGEIFGEQGTRKRRRNQDAPGCGSTLLEENNRRQISEPHSNIFLIVEC